MARDVEADVRIEDKSEGGLRSFLANLRKADDQVKSTQKGIDKAAESTGKFGKEADENAKAFQKLSRELEVSKKELGDLAKAYANASTTAERNDIAKVMRKQQAEVRSLTKNSDILKDLLPDDHELKQEAQSFGDKLSGLFAEAGEIAGPALGIGVVAAAPAIGAAISGAVVGGVGLGGIVGGLLLAQNDPRVGAAVNGFTTRLVSRLNTAADPFVGVWLDAVQEIGGALDGINFEGIFADAAKEAGPLIAGIAGGLTDLGRGIEDVVHNAGPEVAAIGSGIQQVSESIGDGLSELASNGQASAEALDSVFNEISDGIDTAFKLTDALTKVYGVLHKIGGLSEFTNAVAPLKGLVGDIEGIQSVFDKPTGGKLRKVTTDQASAFHQATDATDQYGQAILTTGAAIESFTSKVDRLANSGRSLFDSTTQVGQAIDNFNSALKQNGKTLDANTAKGQNNRSALSGVAAALVANYDAYVQVNGETAKSNQIAGENRAKFIALAEKLNLSKTAASNLATELGLIPAKKSTDFTANTHDAAARIEALKEQIASVHGKSVSVVVSASISRKSQNTLDRLGGGFAAEDHFAFATAGSGIHRTGGVTPVSVDNTTSVQVDLDGRPFRAYTQRSISAAGKASAWRQKVGRR